MNVYKKSLCTLFAVLIGALLFAESNWWEEDDFFVCERSNRIYANIFNTEQQKNDGSANDCIVQSKDERLS